MMKHRKSNIEILRILAMFLVLVLHAVFFTFGIPTSDEIRNEFLPSFSSFFVESLAIVCVNIFILISGWFRIKPKIQGLLSFLFQCIFFYTLIYVFSLLLGIYPFTIKNITYVFLLTDWNWFILAYVGLYLISPMLNRYLDNSNEREIRYFIIYFFLFQTIYSWLFGAAKSFVAGYSTLSFIGLYVLAAYVKCFYSANLRRFRAVWLISLYIIIQFFHSLLAILMVSLGYISLIPKWYSYINPIVIISSLSLFLFFSKIKISSNLINKVSISSFGVFLIHFNPWLTQSYYCKCIRYFNNNYSGLLFVIYVFLFLILVFLLGIMIDKLRILTWVLIVKLYNSKFNKQSKLS